MKKILLLILPVIVLCGCSKQSEPYEFYTGEDGQILWRCNKQTGEILVMTTNVPSFEISHGQFADYLLDKQSGETWRYYRNDNPTNGMPDSEGFSYLHEEYQPNSPEIAAARKMTRTWAASHPKPTNAPVSFRPEDFQTNQSGQ